MRLIKAEFKKTLTEAISYYPDYIVGLITDLLLLVIVMNTDGDRGEKVFGYILWILVNGVLSEASMCISTEKQLGTLQNLLIKPCSISQIIVLVCIGIMGLSYILSALTLVFTKVASFVSVIGYLFLFLSGSIITVPDYLSYTNPLSAGVKYISLVLSDSHTVYDFFILCVICVSWFLAGRIIFTYIFSRSKQFKWTY